MNNQVTQEQILKALTGSEESFCDNESRKLLAWDDDKDEYCVCDTCCKRQREVK